MAKKSEPVKALVLFREEGAYGFMEVELPMEVIEKSGKIVGKSSPDIFAIFITQFTKKARDIFGI